MKLEIKLSYRNLVGAGLRTWLNVFILSLAFVVMLFYNGMIEGWSRNGARDMIRTDVGAGQYWMPSYDQMDPFSYKDAHQLGNAEVMTLIEDKTLAPVLIREATAYPQGRMQGIVLRGMLPDQEALPDLPTAALRQAGDVPQVILGRRMAQDLQLKEGDFMLIRWRDVHGAFDARQFQVGPIFNADNPAIDYGQIYIHLKLLQEMCLLEGQYSFLTLNPQREFPGTLSGWVFHSQESLMADFFQAINAERTGAMVVYFFLLLIGMLAIFDTQVLSVFRRTQEIGTYIALGMTRAQVVGLFTVEGTMHSLFAVLMGALWATPLFLIIDKVGINFGAMGADDFGYAMPQVVYPHYSPWIVALGVVTLVITSALVSYIPARKIVKLKPADAIRGKR